MIERHSLVTLEFINDWLLPVDVGNFFSPNHVNILVSLCVIPFIGVVSTFVPLSAHNIPLSILTCGVTTYFLSVRL